MENNGPDNKESIADLAYTVVGISVLTFQRSMVLKNSLQRKVNRLLGELTTTLEHLSDFPR